MATIDKIKWEDLSEDELNLIVEKARQALDQIKKHRFEEVQDQIRQLANSVGMSPEEVVMQMQRSGGRRSDRSGIGNSEKNVRYRNPENPTQTWTGRGKRPNWLLEKLNAGANLDDFKA
jgi:DNA-binding protein H-NS